jgi:uncharacterized SAM-binding protein YcdF (DUF218 family)
MRQGFKIILIMGIMGSLLGGTGCVSMKKRPLRLYHKAIASGQTFDAIIVPGIPFEPDQWSSLMRDRVLWSYHLYKKGIAKNVIYSGSAVYTPYVEAWVMGLYATQLGIPSSNIFYDTLAEHSTENIFYAYQLARRLGFKTIALATDPIQSSFLKLFTRKRFGTAIVHLPVVADTLIIYDHFAPEIDSSKAFRHGFIPITEREGFWKRLKGTMGGNIPWEDKNKKKALPL